jgi:hypothetical protein
MRRLKRNHSGQVLIIAALAIAFLISSTIVYTYQSSRVANVNQPFTAQDFVRNVKLGSRNLVIGCLANISGGGNNESLEANLDRWLSFVESQYYLGQCTLGCELCEDSPYSSGLWMSWGEDGSGVTSAKVDFSMALTGEGTEMSVNYPVNVMSSLSISGAYSGNETSGYNVSMIIYVRNEGEPALAKNLTVYYQIFSGWLDARQLGSYALNDYGNGTYGVSFTILGSWTSWVSVNIYDEREIFVRTTLLLTQS